MAMRLDEVISGIKADVAVKIFGDDAQILEQQADQVLRVLRHVPGAADIAEGDLLRRRRIAGRRRSRGAGPLRPERLRRAGRGPGGDRRDARSPK